MTGPKEFNESFDGPLTEEIDLVGASLEDTNPILMDDSIHIPIPQSHPIEHNDDYLLEITKPKSILIQP